jgi:AbrB family looped-hinge helix DNA binding protein
MARWCYTCSRWLYPSRKVGHVAYRIGPKGQVVVPKEYRDSLGLRPGASVTFRLRADDGVLEVHPAWSDAIADGPAVIQRLTRPDASAASATDTLLAIRGEDDELWLEQLARLSRKRSS